MNRFEMMVYECMQPTAALLGKTADPLHCAMLLNFWRHVHLEGSGQFDRIVAPAIFDAVAGIIGPGRRALRSRG